MHLNTISSICQETPAVTVVDNRGLSVREVMVNRDDEQSEKDIRITQHT